MLFQIKQLGQQQNTGVNVGLDTNRSDIFTSSGQVYIICVYYMSEKMVWLRGRIQMYNTLT